MNYDEEVKINFFDKLFDSYRKEIDCLWKRSIFLGTFLVLIFTGYGSLVKIMLETKREICGLLSTESDVGLINFLLCIIAFIGIVLSVLWILMAKGSKAWQETYENKINIFEEALGIRKLISGNLTEEEFRDEYDVEPGILSVCFPKESNNSIFSLKAGTYSVGKINIFLGIVFYIVWVIAFCFHFMNLFLSDCVLECLFRHFSIVEFLKSWYVWELIMAIGIVVITTELLKFRNKSGDLK